MISFLFTLLLFVEYLSRDFRLNPLSWVETITLLIFLLQLFTLLFCGVADIVNYFNYGLERAFLAETIDLRIETLLKGISSSIFNLIKDIKIN